MEKLNYTQLSKRWSKALIKKYSPTVIGERKNIYGGTTKFYSIEEVKKIERRKSFKEDMEKTLKRKERAIENEKKIYEEKIKSFISKVNVKIPKDKEKLIDKAIKHYNQLQYENKADRDCCKEFIIRITQNYVRHMCSNYEDILNSELNSGKYKGNAYVEMKEYINRYVNNILN